MCISSKRAFYDMRLSESFAKIWINSEEIAEEPMVQDGIRMMQLDVRKIIEQLGLSSPVVQTFLKDAGKQYEVKANLNRKSTAFTKF
jgi:DNA-binding transcriptional regulator LsrR (DeoR family)